MKPVYENANERRFNETLSTNKSAKWYNFGRADAYAISPYDETLLIDADYFIQSSELSRVWGSAEDVMISKSVKTLEHFEPEVPERWLNPFGIALYWATAVYFKKSKTAKILFDMVAHIRENYPYYAYIYGFPQGLYRNDYAFSIAVHTMNGAIHDGGLAELPIKAILTSFDCDELVAVPRVGALTFLVNDSKARYRFGLSTISGIDVHIMNKYSIGRHVDTIISLYKGDYEDI
jgi:hypothetical protein